jgi:hypothetical protein
MKKIATRLILAASVIIGAATVSEAQIIVKVRPAHTTVVRTVAPSPRHVWVNEDWAPQGNTYVYRGGYWVEPPVGRSAWVEGHWKNRRRGWVWVPGHWK